MRELTPSLSVSSDQNISTSDHIDIAKPVNTELPHIGALDGVRGIAIIFVLIMHGRVMGVESTLDDYFMRLTGFGFCGVDLFFVLSGFLITRILLNTKRKSHYFKSFYGRRLVRIFPVYYAFLFVAFFVLPELFKTTPSVRDHQWWYWTYMTNVMPFASDDGQSFSMSITWSLAVEEHFYMIWPAVVFFCSTQTLRRLVLVLVPATFILRVAMHTGGLSPSIIYGFTFCRMDALLLGAFVAILATDRESLGRLRKPAMIVAAVCLASIGVIFLIDKGFNIYSLAMQSVGFSAFGLMFACVIVLVLTAPTKGWSTRLLNLNVLKLFGKYSYSIYLIHIPIQELISAHLWGRQEMDSIRFLGTAIPGQLIGLALLFVATLITGFIIWNLFERHFLRLKRYFSYGKGRLSAPA